MAENVQFILSADDAKAIAAFQRTVDQQKKSERQFGKTTKAMGRQNKTLSQGARAVGSYAAQFATLGTAITVVTRALRELSQVREAAGRRIESSIQGTRSLLQIANNETDLKKLQQFVSQLRTQGGFTKQGAQATTFSAASAGERFITDEARDTLISLRKIGFTPQAGIGAAQKLQAAFGGTGAGRAGGGNFRQVIAKTLAAAGPSPVAAQDIAKAASSASASFSAIGGQDESLLGLGAVLSEQFKTPEASFERVKSLSDQLVKKRSRIKGAEGLTGFELIRALPRLAEEGKLQSKGGEAQTLQEFLGEANALQAIQAIQQQQAAIEKRIRAVRQAEGAAGTERGLLSQKVRLAPEGAQAVTAKERQTQRREVAEEKRFGTANTLADAVAQEALARIQKGELGAGAQGFGPFSARQTEFLAERGFTATQRFFQTDKEFLRARLDNIKDPKLKRQVRRVLNPAQAAKSDRAADRTTAEEEGLRQLIIARGRRQQQETEEARGLVEDQRETTEAMRGAAEAMERSAKRLERATDQRRSAARQSQSE